MRTSLLSLLFAVTFSQSAFAIRSVGNGGGLAEMQVVYLNQNLGRFLKLCLTAENTCQISSATRAEWENISDDQRLHKISFVTEMINEKGFSLEGDRLNISSKMLYLDLNTPYKFNDLLAFVVSMNQELTGTSQTFKENLQIATRVFKDLSFEEQSHKAVGINALLSLHQLKVFDGLDSHLLVSLEDDQKTISITEAIKSALPCGEISDWNLNQWSTSVTANTLYMYGFAAASCNGKRLEKRIVIKVGLSNLLLINENKISVNFYAND